MHVWCERRNVHGPCSQHARNQRMSTKSESGDEATITSNTKRSSKPKRKAGEIKRWTPEAKRAFKNMKKYIAKLPMVTVPKPKEELIMYLCAAREAVRAVLLMEKDSRQVPVYFVPSRALQTPKINYNSMEKLVLALVHATRRLRRYFQAHPMVVIMDQPIKQILSRPKNTRIMLKWKFKLEAFDITYRPKTSIRGQILADFIAERPDEEGPSMEVQAEEYLEKFNTLIDRFKIFSIEKVPGSENKKVDALSKIASTSFAHLTKQVLVETLKRKSIEKKEILAVVEEEWYCWMTPLVEYLMEGTLPSETKKARTIKIKARRYTMVNDVLYRKSFLEPWLQCVGPTQAEYVVKEIHEGSCSMHSGSRSMVEKAIRSGYYWSTMHKDARNTIRKCPFLEAQGKVKFLIIAVDYFTKWIKAKPVATITRSQVKKFVWDNIVCRFGLLGEIISDNRKQFNDNPFMDWCENLNIKQSNGDTPFSLAYGTEAVIPVEIGMPSIRCAEVNQAKNDKELLLNLDILEERRDKAAVREARNKAKMESTKMPKFAAQASAQEILSTVAMKQAMPKKAESWVQSGKDVRGGKSTQKWSVQAQERKRRRTFAHMECPRLEKMLSLIFHHVSTPANVKPH
nr:reverse transcriptase domain-containing protein [Tanacetum cinerariifolium]